MNKIIPNILAFITKKPRQIITVEVDFKWSLYSWTHNIFRVYELICGRKIGIKAEVSSYFDEQGNECQEAHSFEAMVALIEMQIRMSLSRVKIPHIVKVPVLSFVGINPFPTSIYNGRPYLFAIAFDAHSGSTDTSSGSTKTLAHTITGSNPALVTGVYFNTSGGDQTLSTLAFNGSSATKKVEDQAPNGVYNQFFLQINPSTGTHNNVFTTNIGSAPICFGSTSYSGINQSLTVDSSNHKTSAAGSPSTLSTTVVVPNCWLVASACNLTGTSAGTGGTLRYNSSTNAGGSDRMTGVDSNGTVSTGSQSISINSDGTNGYAMTVMSLAPATATVANGNFLDLL